jgi:hypothetical protein
LKGLKPKDAPHPEGVSSSGGRHGEVDFHERKLSDQTRASTTDPEALPALKSYFTAEHAEIAERTISVNGIFMLSAPIGVDSKLFIKPVHRKCDR